MVNNPLTGAIDVVAEPEAHAADLTPEHRARQRRRAVVEGVVVEVTIAPVTAPPCYRALLRVTNPGAEPCTLELLWHGQHVVPGVTAGTRLRCLAVVCFPDGVATMYNPRYEIITPKKAVR